ncbi:MAG: hypothetical protein MUF42_09370 [Cytophagaceae bacterium]|jgi:hypothetical protein|nr:hypothetical protein [Cytophagaceae bacterium]
MKTVFFTLFLIANTSPFLSAQYYLSPIAFPQAPSSFELPNGISVQGTTVFALSQNDTVYRYHTDGTYLSHWSCPELEGAVSIKVMDDTCYFVRLGPSFETEVVLTKSDGTFIEKWEREGSFLDKFRKPLDLCIDKARNIFVVDQQKDEVFKFTNRGSFLRSWVLEGGTGNYGVSAHDIETDELGYVYVLTENSEIQKYDSSGTFIAEVAINPSGEAYSLNVDAISFNPYDNHLYALVDSIENFNVKKTYIKAFSTALVNQHKNSELRAFGFGEFVCTESHLFLAAWSDHLIYKLTYSTTSLHSSDSKLMKEASIFPNPAKESCSVKLPAELPVGPISYRIIDASGNERVSEVTWIYNSCCPLKLDALESGLYTVQLRHEDQTFVSKLNIIR